MFLLKGGVLTEGGRWHEVFWDFPSFKTASPISREPPSPSWAKGPLSFLSIPQTLRCRASPTQNWEEGYSLFSKLPVGTSLLFSCLGSSLSSLVYSQNLLLQLSGYMCINKIYVFRQKLTLPSAIGTDQISKS